MAHKAGASTADTADTPVSETKAIFANYSAAELQAEMERLRKQIADMDSQLAELGEQGELRKDALNELVYDSKNLDAIASLNCKEPDAVKKSISDARTELRKLQDELDSSLDVRGVNWFSPIGRLSAVLEPGGSRQPTATCEAQFAALNEFKTRLPDALQVTNAWLQKEQAGFVKRLNRLQGRRDAFGQRLTAAIEASNEKNHSETVISKLPVLVIILGVFSLAIMVMVRRFKEPIQKNWVESGQVIQFMTVTILVNVILVLGLGGILSGETLGTLLGGIAGYMLSQGVARAATRTRQAPGAST